MPLRVPRAIIPNQVIDSKQPLGGRPTINRPRFGRGVPKADGLETAPQGALPLFAAMLVFRRARAFDG